MKLKHLLLTTALFGSLAASAVKATPEIVSITNPDGTTVQVRIHGDEKFNYITDVDNSVVLNRNAKGFITPLTIDSRQLTTSSADIAQLRGLKQYRTAGVYENETKGNRMAALQPNGQTTYTTIGSPVGLVVLVEFSDVSFMGDDPRQSYDDLCNKPGYDEYGSRGSARDYFSDVSNGKFTPHFDVVGPVKLPRSQKYYAVNGELGMRDKIYELIADAITALDADVDFSKYDVDNNGLIDNIFFYYAGYGQADTYDPNYIWPHQGDYRMYTKYGYGDPITVDGVEMATYACANELKAYNPTDRYNPNAAPWRDGIGTFCHEYGHVLGIPDFYDTENTNQGTTSKIVTPGTWDIMDQGSYNSFSTCPPGYSAYERWMCKWMPDFTEVAEGEGYDVPALPFGEGAEPVAYQLSVYRSASKPAGEIFIFETRKKHGWDSYLPGEGLVMWHVNFDRNTWETNKPNVGSECSYMMIPNYSIKDAQGKVTAEYAWPGTKNPITYITKDTEYNLSTFYPRPYKFDPYITGIAFDSESSVAHFNYNKITAQPDVVTKMLPAERAENDVRDLFVQWEPYPGATDYLLTLTRTDDKGTVRIIDRYDNRSTEGKTRIGVYNFNESAWKQKFSAQVRVVTEMPSTRLSEMYTFTTDQLKTGVTSITGDDEPIFVENGRIVAPAGARVFSINGAAVNNENLPAGLYIVRYGNKSAKVMVR